MFKIYADDLLFYDDESPLESLKVLSPKLSIAQNSVGSLTFTVPPGNVGYDHLERLITWIRVFKNTQEDPYWEGRILTEKTDFWNCKQITCEGILGVLNDTIQPPHHYQNQTGRSFLEALLNIHNAKVDDWKKIYVGNSDAQFVSSHRYTNYESTLECINDKLLKDGGYLSLRYDDGKRYLDLLTNYPAEHSQKIEFGKNLLDFTKSFSSEDYCTVLVPRGAQLGEGPYEALVPYTDVSSVNDGSIYVYLTNDDFETPPDTLPLNEFGWIEAVHDWEDVYEPTNLLRKAKQYLKDVQFDNMQLEVNALDLRYAGLEYDEINLNDTIRVVSDPHGLDRLFPVTKLDIPLDAPESTVFTLGTNVKVSLTHRDKKDRTDIKNEIASIPTEQRLTEKFKNEAAAMIETATHGYVNIITNEETGAQELVISNTPDYLTATYIWRWNLNGLAFSSHGYNSGDYTVAITADGKINADLISTGTLIADIIKAGILRDQVDGQHFWFNLETGEGHIKAVDDQFTTVNSKFTTVNNNIDAANGRIDDANDRIDETSRSLSTSFATEINVVKGNVQTAVSRIDELDNGIDSRIQSVVDQTANGLTVNITEAKNQANTINQTLNAYFEFLGTGLKIRGTSGSNSGSYLNLAADEVGLYVDKSKKLWLTAAGANADAFNATSYVSIGNFLWEQYSGGFRLRKK